jgi:hypothetical protein
MKQEQQLFTLPKFRKGNMVKVKSNPHQMGKVTRIHSEKLSYMYEADGIRGVFAEVELIIV